MEAKCYRAMRRAQCVVLKKFSQHVIAETRTEDGFGDEDVERFRRRGRRTVPETMMENEGRRRLREKNAGHPAHLATHFSMGSLLFLIIVISQNGFCP